MAHDSERTEMRWTPEARAWMVYCPSGEYDYRVFFSDLEARIYCDEIDCDLDKDEGTTVPIPLYDLSELGPDPAASLSALKAEVVKWKWLASRARCGCLAKDCCVHGSYYKEPDEIAPVVFRSYEQAKDLQRQYYDTALKEPDRE